MKTFLLLAMAVWLCRPGIANDPCAASRTATVISNGKIVGIRTQPASARAAAFDCFYVYPTVSPNTSDNASLQIHPQERGIAVDEASRFSQVCNVWVPVYRQITVKTQDEGRYDTPAYGDAAYASVVSAWRDYRAHYNGRRPIVFVGHSQGVQMLVRLLRQEIEPHPALLHQVLLAILVGGNVAVAETPGGRGSFTHIPPCSSKGQTQCTIGYSLFNETPPPDSRFGIPGQGASFQGKQFARTGVRIVCTNPAALSGGSGTLDAYLRTRPNPHAMAAKETAPSGVTTPWVEYRETFTAECRNRGDASWLNVARSGPANAYPRLFVELPKFGLHNYDLLLPLGNLIDDIQAAEATHDAQ